MSSAEPWQEWIAGQHRAVLVTLRADGRAQSSNISFAWRDGVARISVTKDRAKTRNAQRDPRVVLHVLGDSFWNFLSVDGVAEVSDVAQAPDDAVVTELADVYAQIRGEPHPDLHEFGTDMVAQSRQVLRIRTLAAVGNTG